MWQGDPRQQATTVAGPSSKQRKQPEIKVVAENGANPQIALHKTNTVVTSDCHVHFYGWSKDRWTLTTTVSLQNAHHLSAALSYGTAVVLGAAHNNI